MRKINKDNIKKVVMVLFDVIMIISVSTLLKDIINPTTFFGWVSLIILIIILIPIVNILNRKHFLED